MTFDGGRNMVVVKCGASGHNIRSRPGLNAAPVGKLALGNMVTIQEYVCTLVLSCYTPVPRFMRTICSTRSRTASME